MKKLLLFSVIFIFVFISCDNVKKSIKNDSWDIGGTDEDATSQNDETTDPDSDSQIIDESNDSAIDETAIDTDDTDTTDEIQIPDEDIPVLPIEYESGYIEIGSNSYTLDNKNMTSGAARMWYNFQPADENPVDKPLFVFFNGGPGAATMLLFSYNTSKMTSDQAFAVDDVVENSVNWNQMGNLLYVDARMTGFSYGITANPSNQNERSDYFDTNNFNVYVDAADFIRVILGFLERHPDILANKIILVGESYGGTRATAMLNILLNVRDYAAGNRNFVDTNLFATIDNHFRKVYPEMSADPHKEVIKQQFGTQILIQPLVLGSRQFDESGRLLEIPGSPVYTVESETGVNYSPCASYNPGCEPHNNVLQYLQQAGRDMYAYRKPYNWLFDYTDVGAQKMVQMALFEKLIQNDPRKIDWLYAANRQQAFRYPGNSLKGLNSFKDFSKIPATIRTEIEYRKSNIKPMIVGDLETTFGTLASYDEYFIDLDQDVTNLFYYASTTPYSNINGDMFVENIRDIKTFITQAEEDMIIYAPGIPAALKLTDGVSDVVFSDNSISVTFDDSTQTEIMFPFYPESSHSVSVNQPEMFFNDVNEWLYPK